MLLQGSSALATIFHWLMKPVNSSHRCSAVPLNRHRVASNVAEQGGEIHMMKTTMTLRTMRVSETRIARNQGATRPLTLKQTRPMLTVLPFQLIPMIRWSILEKSPLYQWPSPPFNGQPVHPY